MNKARMARNGNLSVFLALLALIVSGAHGKEQFGRLCVAYALDDPLDDVPDGHFRRCVQSSWFEIPRENPVRRYCKTYRCSEVSSCQETVVGDDGCTRCIDKCQWGGVTYQPGQGGVCEDGCNTCTCRVLEGRAVVTMTEMGCGHRSFCSPRQ